MKRREGKKWLKGGVFSNIIISTISCFSQFFFQLLNLEELVYRKQRRCWRRKREEEL
jgi:hypothetical protein